MCFELLRRRKLVAVGVGVVLGIIACSQAPVVPVKKTNRNVLAEVVFDDST